MRRNACLIERYGTLAQSVEHLTFNQVVGGSNPPCLMFGNETSPETLISGDDFVILKES